MQGDRPSPPSPWELPCPWPDTSPAARPGFRHSAVPPRSSVSGKQGMEPGAAKANTGSGKRCSGLSPPAGSRKSSIDLHAGCALLGTWAPCWRKQGLDAPVMSCILIAAWALELLHHHAAGTAEQEHWFCLWGVSSHNGIPWAQAAGVGPAGFPSPSSDPSDTQTFLRHKGLGSMVPGLENRLCVCVCVRVLVGFL